MSVDHVKSTPITNLDATPFVQNTNGEGGPGSEINVSGSSVAVASSSVDATYRWVRVPTSAKIKNITFTSQAQAAGKVDVGVYYPTTGKTAKTDVAANAIDQDLFATAVDCASAVAPTNITNESGTYTIDLWNTPLWSVLGLTTDPGGYFDIAGTVVTTAVTTGTGIWGISVTYVE